MRRRAFRKEKERRQAEARVRGHVAEVCRGVQARGVPMAAVTCRLRLSERTVRRWRAQPPRWRPARRGRRPQWATRADRNEVYQFLRPRGTSTPLAAVRAAFPKLRRDDLKDVLRRFRDDDTKRLLAEYDVVPLFSPKRRPRYNGGVERANGQLADYQEAVAESRGRRAGPTREDAETARQFANDLAHPSGWLGPTAGQLWAAREPITAAERSAFLATVAAHRSEVRAEWQFAADAELTHDEAAAVDRHAVRDALVEHGLLRIHPRRRRKTQAAAPLLVTATASAGILELAMHAVPPMVVGAADSRPQVTAGVNLTEEEAHLLRQ